MTQNKKIKLSNRSRKNREFYDALLRTLAVEINIGSTRLNRDLMLPSFRPIHDTTAEHIGSHVEKRGWDTPADMLPASTLDAIDNMLADAASQNMKDCCDKIRISQYLINQTDLTTCHLCALNELHLTTYHKKYQNTQITN